MDEYPRHGEKCDCEDCQMIRKLRKHGRCPCYLCRELEIIYTKKEDGAPIMMVTTTI